MPVSDGPPPPPRQHGGRQRTSSVTSLGDATRMEMPFSARLSKTVW